MPQDSRNVETAYQPKLRPQTTRRKTASLRNRRTSRRETLASLGLLGATAVTASVLRGGLDIHPDENAPNQSTVGVHRTVGEQNRGGQPEIVDTRDRRESDKINSELSKAEVEKQVQIIKQSYLGEDDFQRVSQYEQLIRQSADDKVPQDLLIGLVIFESRGNADWVSQAGAAGLTQMMKDTAAAYGLNVSDDPGLDERFIPKLELPATVRFLFDAHERWGDWSLAVWEYQIGAKQLYVIVQDYLGRNGTMLDPMTADLDEAQSLGLREKYKEAVGQNKITAFKILADEQIASKYTGEVWNYTDTYVKGVYAAAQVYYQMKGKREQYR